MSEAAAIEGGCQCGAVRYRIAGEPVFLSICGCASCRKQSGSAFGMSLRVRRADFHVQGETRTWSRAADSGATIACAFCETCGTRLWHAPGSAPDFVHVKPGTLDQPDALAPRYMSYTANMPDWVHVDGVEKTWPGMPDRDGRTARR